MARGKLLPMQPVGYRQHTAQPWGCSVRYTCCMTSLVPRPPPEAWERGYCMTTSSKYLVCVVNLTYLHTIARLLGRFPCFNPRHCLTLDQDWALWSGRSMWVFLSVQVNILCCIMHALQGSSPVVGQVTAWISVCRLLSWNGRPGKSSANRHVW